MKLVWARYQNSNKTKHFLFLLCGRRNGKYCGVYVEKLGDVEISRIRRNIEKLKMATIDESINWIFSNVPSVKDQYREIRHDRLSILTEYTIGKA